jgi:hypothetical protein
MEQSCFRGNIPENSCNSKIYYIVFSQKEVIFFITSQNNKVRKLQFYFFNIFLILFSHLYLSIPVTFSS